MGKRLHIIQRFTNLVGRYVCPILLCVLLSSCAPINNNKSATSASAPKKSVGSASISQQSSHYVSHVSPVRETSREISPTVFGVPVPGALAFSRLTRLLSKEDEKLDQAPAPLPHFPTVSDQPAEEATDSVTIEDERSLLLLSEAERFAEFSENKTLSEIARGSLNRTIDLVTPSQKAMAIKPSHELIVILALCIGVMITCGYFIIAFILDDMRVRKSPRFGPR